MTQQQINEICARCEEASPGPWTVHKIKLCNGQSEYSMTKAEIYNSKAGDCD